MAEWQRKTLLAAVLRTATATFCNSLQGYESARQPSFCDVTLQAIP